MRWLVKCDLDVGPAEMRESTHEVITGQRRISAASCASEIIQPLNLHKAGVRPRPTPGPGGCIEAGPRLARELEVPKLAGAGARLRSRTPGTLPISLLWALQEKQFGLPVRAGRGFVSARPGGRGSALGFPPLPSAWRSWPSSAADQTR